MRLGVKKILLTAAALFLIPLAVHAAIYATENRPRSWSQANWSSTGMLEPAATAREARLLVFAAKTGRWKGIFSVHSWIVIKPEGATSWTRYDVVGWGNPVRINGWAPDGRWFGDNPRVLADLRGADASRLIPKLQAAIDDYAYASRGDYRVWPGPNSNTFVQTVLRAVPELDVTLPSNAIGKDFHGPLHVGVTPSRTGIEASVYGLFGATVAWAEGIELNLFGLVAGLDLRNPAIKVPGFGRIGFDMPAVATPAPKT